MGHGARTEASQCVNIPKVNRIRNIRSAEEVK